MGKRSNFERRPRDFYPTPKEAALVLEPYIGTALFYEPCVGDGDLVRHLEDMGSVCMGSSDHEIDATSADYSSMADHECFITNPPWDRKILHPIIENLSKQAPTWLLFDADWMHTKQSAPYMRLCRAIVSVGRVKWIPDSKMTGKDNCCWYLFDDTGAAYSDGRPVFHSR